MATLADRKPTRRKRRWLKVALVTVPAIVLAGSLSGYLANSGYSNDWFAALKKPSIMPPSWAFPVAWTTLYALMGVALAQVLTAEPSRPRTRGLVLFFLQLALNFSWSPVFFGAGMIDWGFLIIMAMNVAVTATIIAFSRVNGVAGLLLLPYLAWLCLATTLNWEIGRLNPGADRAPLGITGA
uniref:TspO/MBR family protein n=1 Tax=uncultured Sphingomonas sp. TaxID=158754 RepID=UPI0025D69BBB|nr:TspO/MBR family protein [uncultured Sphingomonas sp.]